GARHAERTALPRRHHTGGPSLSPGIDEKLPKQDVCAGPMPLYDCGFPGPQNHQGRNALIQHGPTIEVNVGFDPNWSDVGRPNIPSDAKYALVDTGATASCIDDQLAQKLQLAPIDRQLPEFLVRKS